MDPFGMTLTGWRGSITMRREQWLPASTYIIYPSIYAAAAVRRDRLIAAVAQPPSVGYSELRQTPLP